MSIRLLLNIPIHTQLHLHTYIYAYTHIHIHIYNAYIFTFQYFPLFLLTVYYFGVFAPGLFS